jgi:ribosomal protein S18 acetylase RimI-like enzyme
MEILILNSSEQARAHFENLADLLYECLLLNLPDEGWALDDARSQVERLFINLDENAAFLFMAFEADKLIGFAWTYQRQFGRRIRMHINHIVVQSDNRGAGVGRSILEAIIKRAQDLNMDAIDLLTTKESEDVVRFYLKNGFCVERLQMIYRIPKA